jgi:hypothetical protein
MWLLRQTLLSSLPFIDFAYVYTVPPSPGLAFRQLRDVGFEPHRGGIQIISQELRTRYLRNDIDHSSETNEGNLPLYQH